MEPRFVIFATADNEKKTGRGYALFSSCPHCSARNVHHFIQGHKTLGLLSDRLCDFCLKPYTLLRGEK